MTDEIFSTADWKTKLKIALKSLATLQTPIARKVSQIIKSRKVKINFFSQMSPNEYRLYRKEHFEEYKERLPLLIPPTKAIISKMTRGQQAYIRTNQIYISDEVNDLETFQRCLIHEVCHYFYMDTELEDTSDEPFAIFNCELRARYAEEKGLSSKTLTRKTFKRIIEEATPHNDQTLQDNIEIPNLDLFEAQSIAKIKKRAK